MCTAIRYYYPNGIEGESMKTTVKEFEDIEKAIKYANRYAKGIRFAGVQVRDEDLKTLYEITSDFEIYDYRTQIVETQNKMIYGVVGAGVKPVEQIKKFKKKKSVIWRNVDGLLEIWNYTKRKWINVGKFLNLPPGQTGSLTLENLMDLSGF